MTRMLVRVRDAAEAAQAAAAGVDLVETDLGNASAVRAVYAGPLRLAVDSSRLAGAFVEPVVDVHADEICLAVDPASPVPRFHAARHGKVVARLTVTSDINEDLARLRDRVHAVMVDAEPAARLLDRLGIEQLDAIGSACRAHGLAFGFGGGLETPDVARLLLLEPDVLGFDTAVRVGHDLAGDLDMRALDAVRSLIPRAGIAAAAARRGHSVIDRIFVRDFVLALSIGAYKAERSLRQRVRFNVDAEIVREPRPPRDMRDVFSYDVMIETIRVFAARPHVVFVESLAEEVAAALLAYGPVQSVTVTVEKLDVIDGSVGIQIHRRRGP